jgi:hypothetical protein
LPGTAQYSEGCRSAGAEGKPNIYNDQINKHS